MELNDLYAEYQEKLDSWEKKDERIRKLKSEANALEERAKKKRENASQLESKRGPSPSWITEIVRPLATELARRKNLNYKVMGPMGLGARVVIALLADPELLTYRQEHYRLVLQPDVLEGNTLRLVYETGEVSEKYETGTLGAAAGFNNITAPLPDSIDEIEQLLQKVPVPA